MADNWMLGEAAALDDYIPNAPTNILGDAAQGVKDWYTSQPSWLDRAKAENQKTLEAYGRGGMGEIAKQLATDTTEAQDLVSAFGVGNIKGVRPPVVPGALAATSEYRPPFYSAVEQAVHGAKQNAAPGQQWAGFLRNQPGVKPEEVEALGLGKLFEQPGSVPKEAVLGEIAANKVNVGEVVKGDRYYVSDRNGIIRQENLTQNEARTLVGQLGGNAELMGDTGPTKFSQYTLPGGENYREMLLTLPDKNAGRLAQINDEMDKIAQRPAREHAASNELANQWDRLNQERKSLEAGAPFKSSHYDEPNILAHLRYNDRVIDGKKTLFVEEVQSDWHQKGKREGYASDAQSFEVLDNDGNIIARTKTREEAKLIADEEFDETSIRAVTGKTGVPDAPFKTTWPELAMKRIIREAAEKGYDKVAWTPGSVQAERYDLSRHVTQLHLTHNRDGAGSLIMRLKDGRTESVPITSKENLAETVGKDIAEKLYEQGFKGNGKASLSGVDLKVGGEGMKGFYDEILPATVNKLVKKHGGRVQQTNMPVGSSGWTTRRAPDGQWMLYHPSSDFDASLRFPTREAAEASLLHGSHSVHTLDITPQLRAQAMKGFPLFTAGGVAATGIMGEMARQDDYRQ